ncbi:MAG: winged helix-turn-helix transcriptional regulator [Candidatus Heimdallarchaeota archaeon]|nr:winged helix-turn-helix transcriptional regulator [Candidatus Heimdallarchaeota archaeon]
MEDTEITKENLEKIVSCLQNQVDFEIMMYFIMYRELSLSQLEKIISHKSRPTVYRHIQNLLEAGIVQESREEKVRGHIKAKIYEIVPDFMNILPHYSQEQIEKMSLEERNELYNIIREALNPTIDFMENILEKTKEYLVILKPYPDNELLETFDKLDFHFTLNYLSKVQYQLFMDEFTKFMQNLIPKLMAEEQLNPLAERSHIFLLGLLPIKKIFDRLMEERRDGE